MLTPLQQEKKIVNPSQLLRNDAVSSGEDQNVSTCFSKTFEYEVDV